MYRCMKFVRNLSILIVGVLLGCTLGQLQATDRHESQSPHYFNRPELNFDSTPCDREMAAYLIALSNLEDAQALADAAWEELQKCLGDNPPPPPTTDDLAGTFSILE